MIKFRELGFETFEDYFEHFFNTLLPSNRTFEYFVDWRKVRRNVRKYLNEISLLNSLTKLNGKELEEHFVELLNKHGEVVTVIPLLIAERFNSGKLNILDPNFENFLAIEFNPSKLNDSFIRDITYFCKKTGIFDLFEEVSDIYDYLLGLEVGLDTNARKNRSGEIFEKMCERKITDLITNKGIKIVKNDKGFSLYPVISSGKSKGKTHDFVIYAYGKPALVIECNFYTVSGSKPISIAESYIEMQKAAQKSGVSFVWVTDGPAWKTMKEPLLRSMKKITWILNYRMLDLISKVLKHQNIDT